MKPFIGESTNVKIYATHKCYINGMYCDVTFSANSFDIATQA